jgi:phenylalanyl-tRNA synthetase beta chain
MPFHPTRAARILVEGTDAGVIGELHPTVCENFSAPEGTLAFELALAPVLTHDPGGPTVAAVPRFPAVYVDIAVVVDENVPAAKVEELIAANGQPELASVRLFDTYRGEQVATGKKSLAFALELRVPDRTMTDEEATAVTERVVNALKSELRAELRA